MKMKLTEAEGSARRLQRDLDQMLNDKVSKESLYAAAEVKRQSVRLRPELAASLVGSILTLCASDA